MAYTLEEKKANLMKANKIRLALAKQRMRKVKQTGKLISVERDIKRKALPPGYRVSKNGKVYYESRINRSDLAGKRI